MSHSNQTEIIQKLVLENEVPKLIVINLHAILERNIPTLIKGDKKRLPVKEYQSILNGLESLKR